MSTEFSKSSSVQQNPQINYGLPRPPAVSFSASIQAYGLNYITTFGAKAEFS